MLYLQMSSEQSKKEKRDIASFVKCHENLRGVTKLGKNLYKNEKNHERE